MIRKLIFVNLSAVLFLSKFLVLIVYDLYNHQNLESLAVYSLIINLTSSIFNVASLRGRVYVLNEINDAAGIFKYNIILLFANLIGILIAFVAFNSFAYFELIMCLAAVKATDNIFDGNISFLQKKLGRTFAFTVMNIKSVLVIIVYAFFIISGDLFQILILEFAVGLLAITCVFILVGRTCIREFATRRLDFGAGISFHTIVKGVFLLSICAGLNALLNTVSLAYLLNSGLDTDAKTLALVFAALAVVTRLLINNAFFFRQEITEWRMIVAQGAKIIAIFSTIGFVIAYIVIDKNYFAVSDMRSVLVLGMLGASVLIIHGINVLLRQRLLLISKAFFLTKYHAIELLVFCSILLVANPGIELLILAYFLLRSTRVFMMAHRI